MIQFIIVGWHFDNFPELIQGLDELQTNNPDTIKIFWSCHKEPSESVKQKFEYKVFPNLGLEDGAYQQALDYLDISDDTVLFLMHDDMIVKDWNFINICLDRLQQGFAFIGNGVNYPEYTTPTKIYDEKYFPRTVLEICRPETKHFFEKEGMAYTFRESFICTTRKYLRDIYDFEVVWETPGDGMPIGPMGNMQQTMLGWKITQHYGTHRMSYLSSTYMDSEWLQECERGKIKYE
jgi:hypothetical protein